MWTKWLGKKYPPLSQFPSEGLWHVSQGQYDGRPIILRVNTSADSFKGHPELPNQVGIAIPFRSAHDNGMPDAGETQELSDLEEQVFRVFESDRAAIVVAVITTGGMREFVLYARDPDEIRARHLQLQAHAPHHEVQLMLQPDPGWTTFQHLRSSSV